MKPTYSCLLVTIGRQSAMHIHAVAAGEVVGRVTFRPGVKSASFHELYVHPDWRGRGIGQKLVEMCETSANGLAATTLIVNGDNREVEPFYVKLGYVPTFEWPDGDVAWSKDLSKRKWRE